MKSLNAIIVDDEPLAHKVIMQYALDIPFLNIVGQFYLATDTYSILSEHSIDLIFLDINMPKLQGLDFIKTLDKKPAIILTTAYEEYALEGYELQVVDYLLKPFRFERFLKAVNNVKSKKELLSTPIDSSKNIFLKVDKRLVQVNLKTIQFFESYGNYVKVWVKEKPLLTLRTLTSFDNELDESFVRVHKSYIVQKSKIDYIEGNMLVMENRQFVTIGKSYRTKIRALFSK